MISYDSQTKLKDIFGNKKDEKRQNLSISILMKETQ